MFFFFVVRLFLSEFESIFPWEYFLCFCFGINYLAPRNLRRERGLERVGTGFGRALDWVSRHPEKPLTVYCLYTCTENFVRTQKVLVFYNLLEYMIVKLGYFLDFSMWHRRN